MKNISYVISGVLAIAVIVLFILVLNLKNGGANTMPTNSDQSERGEAGKLALAYVNVDSLLANYEFAKVSGEKLMNKFQSSNNTVTQKQKQLEKEAMDFQRKIQNNAFLSQQKAEQESQRIQKLDMDLQKMAERLQNELAREEQRINEEMSDSVKVCLEVFNRDAGYEIIFSNKGMDNILIAKDSYNITSEVLKLLNSRYTTVKK